MISLPAGDRVVDMIELAYKADLPVLLEGRHGVGKSALLARAAQRLGIDQIVRDLSIMEPPDLVGIPSVAPEGRTRYAPPAFLPSGGRGLLAFEELNRSSRYMQASCLQLLTARRLLLTDVREASHPRLPRATRRPDGAIRRPPS